MISVALATYNGQKYIITQLTSILSQLSATDEVIISDNYSTDDTIQLIESLDDKRVKIFYQKQVSKSELVNCIKNFENALSICRGDFIFLSDQDDIWVNNKVNICVEKLKTYDVLVTDCFIIDDTKNVILNSYFSRRHSGKGIFKNLFLNTYVGSCMVFKSKVLKIALPFPENIPMHDILIGLIGDLFFKVHFLPLQLSFYRNHGNNVSDTISGKSKFSLMHQLFFRWNTVRYIPLLLFRKLRLKNFELNA